MEQNKWRYSKKIHIWNRVRLSLRGKKIIVNQILFSKLWYIRRPNLYHSKICLKRKLKKEYTISPGTEKNTTSQTLSSILHLEGWTGYLRHRHTIKLYKNKMDSKVIKSHQCSLQRSHLYWLKLILISDQGLALFKILGKIWSGNSIFNTRWCR